LKSCGKYLEAVISIRIAQLHDMKKKLSMRRLENIVNLALNPHQAAIEWNWNREDNKTKGHHFHIIGEIDMRMHHHEKK
jgi:hypothetical protein